MRNSDSRSSPLHNTGELPYAVVRYDNCISIQDLRSDRRFQRTDPATPSRPWEPWAFRFWLHKGRTAWVTLDNVTRDHS